MIFFSSKEISYFEKELREDDIASLKEKPLSDPIIVFLVAVHTIGSSLEERIQVRSD